MKNYNYQSNSISNNEDVISKPVLKKISIYKKILSNLMIYSPVIVLLVLIITVYVMFLVNYIFVLMNKTYYNEYQYPFNLTSSYKFAYTKGLLLLIFVSVFFILLLIALFKTIFMDPGYYQTPSNLELKIVENQCILKEYNTLKYKSYDKLLKYYNINKEDLKKINIYNIKYYDLYSKKNRILFLNDFEHIVSSGPLNSFEQKHFTDIINQVLSSDSKANIQKINNNNNYSTSFDRSINNSEYNKINYLNDISSNQSKKSITTNSLDFNVVSDKNMYFKNIEISKAILCGLCLRYKAERSHHCKQCNKCVYKMDHHCPWLANCIGFKNYKFFLLIDLYGLLALLPIIITYWEAVYNYNYNSKCSYFITISTTFSYFVALGLLGFILWLIKLNWVLALTGQSVIENADRERFPINKGVNIYDMGIYKNFIHVFGNNPFYWFLPFNPNYKGDGILFDSIYNDIN